MTKEEKYQETFERVREKITPLKGTEIIIGIPFSDQAETLPKVIEIVNEGGRKFYPEKNIAFVLAGAHQGRGMLKRIGETLKEQNREGYCFT
ncbi:MAG: hypothetical protein KAJ09_12995, partial [Deltaproteobacteria bacterium]|nr:hypothetical protein [Deltaproteobacteria bacterium]